MSITDFFAKLGAPLKNQRWSWGAVRRTDGAVFLRVWQDRKFVENKIMYMMLTHHQKYVSTDEDNLGYKERLEHLERIREGATCYMVMCRVRDQDRSPRQIASFNSEQLFVGGSLIERDGETFIEVIEKRPVADVIA